MQYFLLICTYKHDICPSGWSSVCSEKHQHHIQYICAIRLDVREKLILAHAFSKMVRLPPGVLYSILTALLKNEWHEGVKLCYLDILLALGGQIIATSQILIK